MNTRILRCAGILSVFFLAACAGTRSAPPGMGDRPSEEVTVYVDNLDFNDATIYISVSGSRTRLGNVDGKTQQRFERNWRLPTIAFEIDLLGGRTYRTIEVPVAPGEVLDLLIQSGNVRLIPRGR